MFHFLPSALLLVLLPLVLSQPLADCRINAERRQANKELCDKPPFARQSFLGRLLHLGRCGDCSTPRFTLTGFGFYCGRSPCRGYRCAQCTICRMEEGDHGEEVNVTDNVVVCLRMNRMLNEFNKCMLKINRRRRKEEQRS